jgi:hypothetical protein
MDFVDFDKVRNDRMIETRCFHTVPANALAPLITEHLAERWEVSEIRPGIGNSAIDSKYTYYYVEFTRRPTAASPFASGPGNVER